MVACSRYVVGLELSYRAVVVVVAAAVVVVGGGSGSLSLAANVCARSCGPVPSPLPPMVPLRSHVVSTSATRQPARSSTIGGHLSPSTDARLIYKRPALPESGTSLMLTSIDRGTPFRRTVRLGELQLTL